jgi:hypothetical protein
MTKFPEDSSENRRRSPKAKIRGKRSKTQQIGRIWVKKIETLENLNQSEIPYRNVIPMNPKYE